ncbi:hypothetical protein RFI_36555, partial [Reticulomyxa filosa]
ISKQLCLISHQFKINCFQHKIFYLLVKTFFGVDKNFFVPIIEKSIILKRTYFNAFDVHIVGMQKEISTQFVHVTNHINIFFLNLCVYLHTHDDTKQERFVYRESGDLSGGMQHNTEPNKNAKEIKALMTLFGDAIDESELKKRLEENNGNVALVIEQLTSKLMHRE